MSKLLTRPIPGALATRFGVFPYLALAVWVGISVLSAVQSSLRDPSRSWDDLLAGTLLAWLPWLLFAAPIVRLTRLAWAERRRASLVATHVLAAAVCSVLYLSYLAVFRALPRPAALGAWREGLQDVTGEHLMGALLVYLAIAVTGHLYNRRRVPTGEANEPPLGIPVRRRGRTRFIAPKEIDWVAADGSYARLHLGSRTELLRRPLSRLAEELEPWGFARVHRSALVNLARVREIESVGHGDGRLLLSDGTRVRLSRTYRRPFERLMKARTADS